MDSNNYHIIEFLDHCSKTRYDIALAKWMDSPTRVRWVDRSISDYTYSLSTEQDNEANCTLRQCRIRDSCCTYSEACAILNALRMEEMDNTLSITPILNPTQDNSSRHKYRLQMSTNSPHEYDYSDSSYDYFSNSSQSQQLMRANIVPNGAKRKINSQGSSEAIRRIPRANYSSSSLTPWTTQLTVDLDDSPTRSMSLSEDKSAEGISNITLFKMLVDMQNTLSQLIEIQKNQAKTIERLLMETITLVDKKSEEVLPFKLPISTTTELQQANEELAAPSVQQIFIRRIAVIGGTSFNGIISNIVGFLFTNSFSKKLHGHRNGDELSIRNSQIVRQIAVALRLGLNDSTLSDFKIYKAIKTRINALRSYDERKKKRRVLEEDENYGNVTQ